MIFIVFAHRFPATFIIAACSEGRYYELKLTTLTVSNLNCCFRVRFLIADRDTPTDGTATPICLPCRYLYRIFGVLMSVENQRRPPELCSELIFMDLNFVIASII